MSGVALLGAGTGQAAEPPTGATPTSLFANREPVSKVEDDSKAVELGVKIKPATAGWIVGVRYYAGKATVGTKVGNLWSSRGALLARANFTSTSLGWREIRFVTPVPVTAGTTYIASYFTPTGYYAEDEQFFTTPLSNGGLTATGSVYRYGSSSSYPTSTYNKANYYADVLFVAASATPATTTTAPPATTSTTAAPSTTTTAPPPTTTTTLPPATTTTTTAPTTTTTVPPTTTTTLPSSGTCDRTANSAAALSTEFSAAAGGQTICLASGDYGTFRGGQKTAAVTIRPQSGATASMAVEFNGATNVALDGLTIRDLFFGRTASKVTVRNARFTGFAYIDATGMRDAAVLLDSNTHIDINMPNEQTPPGRVHVDAGNVSPGARSGIVVRNSLFKGGTSDGIRVDGGASIVIEGNEFTAIRDVDPYHADAIQFYGGENVTIRGNYFHDQVGLASCSLGQHDGGGGHIIERNVVVGGSCYYGMYLRDDSSSIVRHNTFAYGSCMANITCGQLLIDGKNSGGSGTLFRDNIFTGLSNGGPNPSQFTADHNLTRESVPGTANTVGTPIFVGGATPTSYEGFRLAPGSPGKGAASDSGDVGI